MALDALESVGRPYRIAYASSRYQLGKQTQFYLHAFRSQASHPEHKKEDLTYLLGLRSMANCIASIATTALPSENWLKFEKQLHEKLQAKTNGRIVRSKNFAKSFWTM